MALELASAAAARQASWGRLRSGGRTTKSLALLAGGLAYVAVFVWDGRVPVEVQAWVDAALRVIAKAAFWRRG